ncbi:MAG: hypothetical protein ACTSP1_17855 [Candidatus Freyarchaeota archaeon]
MQIADMTLQDILTDVEEDKAKADIVALKDQAQSAVTQLKTVVSQLANSPVQKAAGQLRAAIIKELKEAFQE